MTMYSYKIIIILFAFVMIYSCEDRLELEPDQSISDVVALSSASNIANLLIGVYEEAGQDDSYGGQLQMMADLLGSGDITSWNGTFIEPRQVKNKTILADNAFVGNFWSNSYEAINQANLVLDNLAIITDVDESNRVEGEAKFLRGLLYFDLVRHFGSGAEGIPLRTTGVLDYSVDLSISRATTSEVYTQIISDLQSSYDLLPASNDFFADKYAAKALLARVYLQQGNFSEARDAVDDVIANGGHTLAGTFAEAFNHDVDGSEDIFSFQVTSQTGDNDLVLFYADEGNGGRGGDVSVTDSYLDLFTDANDERANFFYESAQSGERLTAKYTNEFGNVPLLRMAEMYLIRAEANLMEGTITGDDPINDLNLLRTRSGAQVLQGPATRDMVLAERVRELAFEGFAIHDVVRTQGTVDGFNYDAPELTMPIPQNEMDTNSSMTQNPGY